jgi:CRISPR-associated protein Cmr3
MSIWQSIEITPLDTLFFREPRPFTAGQQIEAQSVFPPSPMTLQGMLRSWLLARHAPRALVDPAVAPADLLAVIGALGGPPGTLRLRGPWLIHQGTWLLPAPLDLIVQEGCAECLAPRMTEDDSRGTSLPPGLRPLAPPAGWKSFEGVRGWLAWSVYADYLAGRPVRLDEGVTWFPPEALWIEEVRPGVGMDSRQNRAKDGLLYFARHIRLHPGVSLGIEVSGADDRLLGLPAVAALGGEGKAVSLECVEPPPWRQANPPAESQLKLVLTQPAWLQAGWHPSWMHPAEGTATWENQRLTWLAARVERPLRIGGWDLATRRPKPLRAFVPPGTVYYLKADGQASEIAAALWDGTLTENPSDSTGRPCEAFDRIGFGHVLVGTWTEQGD